MIVALTGGTGLVGSAVLAELLEHGHQVTALVRSEESAQTVAEAGATAAIGDLGDLGWLRDQLAAADGAIHTASPGDADSEAVDRGVVQAVVAAYDGTSKPYVHTSGVWVYGSGTDLTEETLFAPPALTAWRREVERELLDADVRASIVAPGIVYDAGTALSGLSALVGQPDEDGRFRLIGDGTQHWTTVSSQQLAELYRAALEHDDVHGYFIGVNEDHPTVREIVEAAAGGAEVVAETADETRARLPAMLVDALLLDQVASAARAHAQLGWAPSGPSLVEIIGA